MIDHFNNLCFWVQERIVKQLDLEERRKTLIFFIEVGYRSVKCGNFDVAMAIFTAFNSAAVSRLKDTFTDLPKKSSKKWNTLIELFSWERSYFNYREKMRRSSAPIVPCLGIITKDLFVIEESNPTILKNNSTITGEELVNFHKFRMLYSHIKSIEKFQQINYGYTKNDDLQIYFNSLTPPDRYELYELSLKCKPKSTQRDTKKKDIF